MPAAFAVDAMTMLAVEPHDLERANFGVMVAGVLAWAVWWSVPRLRRHALAVGPCRRNGLGLPEILSCVLVYLCGYSASHALLERWLAGGVVPDLRGRLAGVVSTNLGQIAGGLACIWFGRRFFEGGLRGFGLRADRAAGDALAGLAAWLMSFPVCYGLLYAAEAALRWWLRTEVLPAHGILDVLKNPQTPRWACVWATLGAVLVAPVTEELFFRGVVQSALVVHLRSRWKGVAMAAAVFGAMHASQPQAVLPLAALGLFLGYVYERRGSLVAPMALHAAFNSYTIIWQAMLPPGP